MSTATILRSAAVLGALAVAAGAYHAHGLKGTEEQLAWWDTATRYAMSHALALLGLAALASRGIGVRVPAICFLIGTLLFSGTLYAMAMGAPRWFGAITPIGGLALIVGWLGLAFRTSYTTTPAQA